MMPSSTIDGHDELQQKIQQLWERHRPQVLDRIATLEAAAHSRLLERTVLEEVIRTAHNLAGSLGMYGFREGSRIAFEVEAALLAQPHSSTRLQQLTAALRRSVD